MCTLDLVGCTESNDGLASPPHRLDRGSCLEPTASLTTGFHLQRTEGAAVCQYLCRTTRTVVLTLLPSAVVTSPLLLLALHLLWFRDMGWRGLVVLR